MKYRWITSVVTRHSGILNIYCNSREQAEENALAFTNALGKYPTIQFVSMNGNLNSILLSDIVAVTVHDNQQSIDIHREETRLAKEIHDQIDWPVSEDDH